MTLSTRLVERYKTAGDKPPARLLALIRRTVSSSHPEYKLNTGLTESPHLFTVKCDTHFSVGMADLKILLRNGLMRIQVNEPGHITLYFADEHGAIDEEPHDAYPNDLKGRG